MFRWSKPPSASSPAGGDSDIRKKDAKIDELDRKEAILKRSIVELTRKLQLLNSQSTSGRSNPELKEYLECCLFNLLSSIETKSRQPYYPV